MEAKAVIKDALKEGKAVIGGKTVMKALKAGSLAGVVVPSNCPADVRKDVDYYTKVSKIEVHSFSGSSAELGQACGKPFKIAILGIEK